MLEKLLENPIFWGCAAIYTGNTIIDYGYVKFHLIPKIDNLIKRGQRKEARNYVNKFRVLGLVSHSLRRTKNVELDELDQYFKGLE